MKEQHVLTNSLRTYRVMLAPEACEDWVVAVCCFESHSVLLDGDARLWVQPLNARVEQEALDKDGKMLEALRERGCLMDDSC
jgi:hypothetical protein